jgi:hypothetical protein
MSNDCPYRNLTGILRNSVDMASLYDDLLLSNRSRLIREITLRLIYRIENGWT